MSARICAAEGVSFTGWAKAGASRSDRPKHARNALDAFIVAPGFGYRYRRKTKV
jgi:hypothetical protein